MSSGRSVGECRYGGCVPVVPAVTGGGDDGNDERRIAGPSPADDPVPQAAPLDTPQEFTGGLSYQVRDELVSLIERDLLGPWDGELEAFPPRAPGPCERYLVGGWGRGMIRIRPGKRPGMRWTLSWRRAGIPGTGSCRTC